MVDARRCPRCGAALETGGECARCLLALGLDAGATDRPQRIGRYRVLDVLDAGEATVTYLAEEDGPARRRVALRVVGPRTSADAAGARARLAETCDRLARVSDPGLARVIDFGALGEGGLWLASEWVRGVPITEHCDRERLTLARRLRLLVETCQAMERAHAGGLIHLNLDPSHVLVTEGDDAPRVRVVGLGVARAVGQGPREADLYSARGLLVASPAYTSPEQLEPSARLDPRSDVYSLGVLLHELLVGAPPFDVRRLRRAGWAETVRILREETPPRPSARLMTLGEGQAAEVARARGGGDPRRLARELRGDLDWIVLRALAKDPGRRYPSARELARDLQRVLDGEPVAPGLRSLGRRLLRAVRGLRV